MTGNEQSTHRKSLVIEAEPSPSRNLPMIVQTDEGPLTLPHTYAVALLALERCASVDEVKDWIDKAAAARVYAFQAKDTRMHMAALRFQDRAVRRLGALLKEVEPAKNQHDASERARVGARPSSRKAVGNDAGLSEHQIKQAIRVANVPQAVFEKAVESEKPPTVTALADQGRSRLVEPMTIEQALQILPDDGRAQELRGALELAHSRVVQLKSALKRAQDELSMAEAAIIHEALGTLRT